MLDGYSSKMHGGRSFVIMRWTLAAALVFVVLIGAGCIRLTMDNYNNRIKAEIACNEVVHIHGSPDKCGDLIGMRSCR